MVALGPLLAALGPLLGRSWAALGRSWLALGSLWGALGLLLRVSWPLLGCSWPLSTTQVGTNWAPRCLRKRCWGQNTNVQKVLGNVWLRMGKHTFVLPRWLQKAAKIVPRAVLAALGRSWTALGPLLAALGRSWLAPGASWADLGASWGDLGPSWGDLGAIKGATEGAAREWGRVGADVGGYRVAPPWILSANVSSM